MQRTVEESVGCGFVGFVGYGYVEVILGIDLLSIDTLVWSVIDLLVLVGYKTVGCTCVGFIEYRPVGFVWLQICVGVVDYKPVGFVGYRYVQVLLITDWLVLLVIDMCRFC